MAASSLVDLVKIYATNQGTGALTLGEAVQGYRGVEALLNGATYSYSIQQDAQWEIGKATFLAVDNQLVRTPTDSSNGGGAVDFLANASVAFVALSEDILARDVLQPLYGFGPPLPGQGLIGQTYTDLAQPVTLYGPKTASGWGNGVVLQGAPGKPGTAASYETLDELKAADPEALFYVLLDRPGGTNYTLTSGDYTGQVDNVFVVKLDRVPLTVGALVRQGAESIRTRLPIPGALDWSQDDVNAQAVSVLGFIPESEHEGIRTGTLTYDCTAAFNLASSAAAAHTGNDSPLKRLIKVPAGKYRIDGNVYVRRGQQMIGDGHTSGWIDYTQSGGNGGIVLGCGDTGIGDPGGLGVRLSGLFFYGAGNPAVDATRPDSWVIDNCMFTECGVGIRAGGTDGRIANTIIDGGDVGIELRQGHTIKVADLTFFNTNSDIRIFSNVADVLISNCQSQFAERVCVEFVAGQSNIRGVLIEGCQFLLNAQYGTNVGFIFRSSSDLDFQVAGCTFRNGRGLAIGYGGGVNVRQQILNCVFDGAKSFAVYDQSTTAGGVDLSNADTTIAGCSFTRLAGPSIYFNPTIGSAGRIKGSTFSANTGEAQEIRIDGGTAASSITIDAATTSDRAIIPAQSFVNIFAMTAAGGTATLAAGVANIPLPIVKDSSRVWLQRRADFGTVGASYSVARNPGVGFTITAKDGTGATQTADTSLIDWSLDLAGL